LPYNISSNLWKAILNHFVKMQIMPWKCSKLQIFGNDVDKMESDHDEIKSRINSENACYHAVLNFISSYLTSKNVTNKIYKP
jgi:hypothetical protein